MGMGRMPEVSMSSPNMKQCWTVGDIWSEHGGGKGSISSMHFPSEIVSVCHRHAESLNETDKWMWQRLKVKPACNDWAIFSFLLKKAAVLKKAATHCLGDPFVLFQGSSIQHQRTSPGILRGKPRTAISVGLGFLEEFIQASEEF